MPDYKEMYLTMVRETEKAVTILEEVEKAAGILIAAQQKCEEMYINAPEPSIVLLPRERNDCGGHETPPAEEENFSRGI